MSARAELDQTDPTFVEDLANSVSAVLAVARYLSAKGYAVEIPPGLIRPTPEENEIYRDNGDLFVLRKTRIEVKHRPELHFTGAADFPFPTMIVDVAHSWDRANPKPARYLICNDDLSHAGVIEAGTREHWIQTERLDRHCGRTRSYYECPIELVQFIRLSPGGE
jgi:hypothetical protein